MTRSTAREIAAHLSYEAAFSDITADELLALHFDNDYYETLADEASIYNEKPEKKQLAYITRVVKGVVEHAAELDSYIEKYSIGWDFSRISAVSTAIMRVCMFEILYMPDIPNNAAISEAVEIAHRYEDDDTVTFINGILGTFVRSEIN